jgi:acetyl-CoA synthetase
VRGKVVEMYVAVKPGVEASEEEVAKKVATQIEHDIGKIARPKNVWVVPDMPKTRSGKIMRRVIAGISNFADVGDISTLANPDIVDEIREQVQAAKKERGEDVQQLSKKEEQEIAEFGKSSE